MVTGGMGFRPMAIYDSCSRPFPTRALFVVGGNVDGRCVQHPQTRGILNPETSSLQAQIQWTFIEVVLIALFPKKQSWQWTGGGGGMEGQPSPLP